MWLHSERAEGCLLYRWQGTDELYWWAILMSSDQKRWIQMITTRSARSFCWRYRGRLANGRSLWFVPLKIVILDVTSQMLQNIGPGFQFFHLDYQLKSVSMANQWLAVIGNSNLESLIGKQPWLLVWKPMARIRSSNLRRLWWIYRVDSSRVWNESTGFPHRTSQL